MMHKPDAGAPDFLGRLWCLLSAVPLLLPGTQDGAGDDFVGVHTTRSVCSTKHTSLIGWNDNHIPCGSCQWERASWEDFGGWIGMVAGGGEGVETDNFSFFVLSCFCFQQHSPSPFHPRLDPQFSKWTIWLLKANGSTQLNWSGVRVITGTWDLRVAGIVLFQLCSRWVPLAMANVKTLPWPFPHFISSCSTELLGKDPGDSLHSSQSPRYRSSILFWGTIRAVQYSWQNYEMIYYPFLQMLGDSSPFFTHIALINGIFMGPISHFQM